MPWWISVMVVGMESAEWEFVRNILNRWQKVGHQVPVRIQLSLRLE